MVKPWKMPGVPGTKPENNMMNLLEIYDEIDPVHLRFMDRLDKFMIDDDEIWELGQPEEKSRGKHIPKCWTCPVAGVPIHVFSGKPDVNRGCPVIRQGSTCLSSSAFGHQGKGFCRGTSLFVIRVSLHVFHFLGCLFAYKIPQVCVYMFLWFSPSSGWWIGREKWRYWTNMIGLPIA